MSRPENTFKRDMTFHVNRRKYGRNIPATDIDFLEYDHHEPVFIWEATSRKNWRQGQRTSGIRAQHKLAQLANIPYFIIEHSKNWSSIIVCELSGFSRSIPIIYSEESMNLKEFVAWLYKMRGRDIEEEMKPHPLLPDRHLEIPDELESIVFERAEEK